MAEAGVVDSVDKVDARRQRLKALVAYRQLLGVQGRPKTRELADGTVETVRRGLPESVKG